MTDGIKAVVLDRLLGVCEGRVITETDLQPLGLTSVASSCIRIVDEAPQ